jgi:GNAT superfamily N-acetyltransferase
MTETEDRPPLSDMLVFRPAVKADIPALQDLYKQLLPQVETCTESMTQTLEKMQHQSDNQVIVAVMDSRVVATCQMCIYDNLARSPRRKAVIDSVVVCERVRNQGIASAMIQWVKKTLADRGCSHAGVAARFSRYEAHHLYPKLEFEQFGYYFLHRM